MEGSIMKPHSLAVAVLAFVGIAVPAVAGVAPAAQARASVSASPAVPLIQPKAGAVRHVAPTELARGSTRKCAQGPGPQSDQRAEALGRESTRAAMLFGMRCPT
jgi:hypothetical protein